MKKLSHPIRGFILDVDGTLLTLADPLGNSYSRVLKGLGIDVAPKLLDQSCRRVWSALHEDYLNVARAYATTHEREESVWREFVRRVLEDARVSCSVELRERAITDIYNFFAQGATRRVAAGAEEFLCSLKQRGVMAIAATNNDRRSVNVLNELGLSSYLSSIIVSGDLEWKKPSPRFFAGICERVGFSPVELVHVGNDRELDVLAAQRAGLQAVHFGAEREGEGIVAVKDFAELASVVGSLFPPEPALPWEAAKK